MPLGYFPGRTAPFVPSDLTEVFCWMDASSSANVLNASAAAASDGENVDKWSSEVGSLDFQNTTDSERPVFTDDGTGANGKPYLLFDGVDDRLVRNGTFTAATSGEMFAIVNRVTPAADNSWFFGLGLSTAETPYLLHNLRTDSAGAQLKLQTDVDNVGSDQWKFLAGPTYLINVRHDDMNVSMFKNRVSVVTPAATKWYGDITAHNRATIGGLTRTTFGGPFDGKIYEMIFCDAPLSATDRDRVWHYAQNKYNPLMTFAALGDSITARSGGDGSMWWFNSSNQLHLDTAIEGAGFIEHAASSETTTDALGRWTTDIKGNGYDAMVILSSVNDIDNIPPIPHATSIANLGTIVDEALSEGLRVILSTVMPFGNGSAWTAALQAELDRLNTWIRGKVAADTTLHLHLVEAYDAFGEPTDPTKMLAAYDSGDGVHPNAAGDAAMGALVKTAIESLR